MLCPVPISETYEVLEELTTGAAAVVYRGVRKCDGLPVILKVCTGDATTPRLPASEMTSVSVPNEYVFLKKVQHIDGCVRMVDFLEEPSNNKWTIVLEDLEATGYVNLAKFINCSFQLNDVVIAWIIRSVVKILTEIHAVGVLHCDIKPDNIFVDFKRSLVKLIDFNFSTSTTFTGHNDIPPCTPDYAPPEVLVNRNPWTVAGEVWSVGCTAFVMLCRRFPFSNPWMSAYMNPAYPPCKFDLASHSCRSLLNYKPERTVTTGETMLSPKAKDFLLFCLTRSPLQRPTLSALSQHPFLKNSDKVIDIPDIDEVLRSPAILVS
ncbi:Serine/threonine-protein kinase pim-3 [Clonorchis sinensis]|uniref:Serine/threonine-protein kinase pim-3 n=2 Tax=Clonorchis sinensis TaxID=79923 RepID=A0A8T1MMC4_CLOSI|nr:Serine/threonine-protein kinase pim-3 [Clonorchis sinensis]GAA56423.1 serine/threonine-protein kinase pim-3 [Clonorchis sinensis]